MRKPPVSASVARRKVFERIAFATVRALSWTAVLALVLVLGFTLWKGFVAEGRERRPETGIEETRIATSSGDVTVVANAAARISSIPAFLLYEIFTDEHLDWSAIDGRGDELVPLHVDPAIGDRKVGGIALAADEAVFGDPSMAEHFRGGLATAVDSVETALARLASDPGAIAVLPSDEVERAIGRGAPIRVLPLRRVAVAVAPGVTEFFGNSKLDSLSTSDWVSVREGRTASWSEVGGPELPVTRALPPEGTMLGDLARRGGFGGDLVAESLDEYRSWFAADTPYPGAVGPEFAGVLAVEERPGLSVERYYMEPNLAFEYLVTEPRLSGKTGGISTILANTFFMIALTLLLAIPLGVGAAVYLVEYAKQGRLVRTIRVGVETLAGVPSIVFGLFGMAAFVPVFGLGLASGSLTLAVMLLPTIVRVSEEALKSVPASWREGSLALGASKPRTIARVVLPAASGGIATGVILAIGRALGETAALVFTMGSGYSLATGLDSSARSLAVHVYLMTAEGISFDRAFASAAVLVFMVFAINTAAGALMRGRGTREA